MSWNQQGGGGPWGAKGQGPKTPWNGGSQGGSTPPNLEDMLKRGQDKVKDFLPGGAMGGRGLLIGALLALLAWLATGAYMVRPNEMALNMLFGKYIGSTGDGLRYNLPYPLGQVIKVRVTDINRIEVGFRGADGGRRLAPRDVIEESLMLTGDENIVDIDFAVQWQVDPAKPQDFVFNIQAPEGAIKAVAESAMREVIGRRNIQTVLTTDRAAIETEVQTLMQHVLDSYAAGVRIRTVQLQKVDPPSQVIDAFRDVQAARQDQDRAKNEAETYASRIVPEARGQAAKILQEAEAYKERTVAEAKGSASRFTQVLDEYKRAPEVTRQRMFLETIERVFGSIDKTIIDQGKEGQSVVPYLPLQELQRRSSQSNTQSTTGAVK
jgi:modulator of FtsH protease HflK